MVKQSDPPGAACHFESCWCIEMHFDITQWLQKPKYMLWLIFLEIIHHNMYLYLMNCELSTLHCKNVYKNHRKIFLKKIIFSFHGFYFWFLLVFRAVGVKIFFLHNSNWQMFMSELTSHLFKLSKKHKTHSNQNHDDQNDLTFLRQTKVNYLFI